MKNQIAIALALLMGLMMLVGCNKEKEDNNKAVFHASIESRGQSKTYLDTLNGQGQVKWLEGDQIRIYNGDGANAVFTLQSGANTTEGIFASSDAFDMVPPYLAVYPSTATMNNEDMVVFEVPAVQALTQTGTFANGANPMLSYTTDDDLYFQNLCGGLGIRLYGDAHVSSITITGVASEQLNGQFKVADEGLGTSPCNGNGGTNKVTLTCDVTLSPTDTTDFYAVLPVGVLHMGVVVEIYDGETKVGQIPYPESSAAQVVRNKIKSFKPVELTVNGDTHEYVDLGLPSGLLWATCNIGADTPEAYGDYFAWGETTPKDTYDWSTYQYCNGSYNTLTKYCQNSSYGYNGFTDNLTTLESGDDAATANWGDGWRMPTKAEFEELLNNTTNEWTIQNGVNGWLFTANDGSGNSLFLPAAGNYWEGELYNANDLGQYWSSLITDFAGNAWCILFTMEYCRMDEFGRYYGSTVRPVREPNSGWKGGTMGYESFDLE